MTLGQRIRQLMEENDISQRKMANELNLATSTLNGYICGTRQPDYEVLSIIAKYFSVSIDYLLGNSFYRDANQLSEAEEELLSLYRNLTQDQQELLCEQAKLYIRHNRKNKEKSSRSA